MAAAFSRHGADRRHYPAVVWRIPRHPHVTSLFSPTAMALAGSHHALSNHAYGWSKLRLRPVRASCEQRTTRGVGFAFVAGCVSVSYTHLRAHETPEHLVCRLLLEKKK